MTLPQNENAPIGSKRLWISIIFDYNDLNNNNFAGPVENGSRFHFPEFPG
jgi:hypothetical protein